MLRIGQITPSDQPGRLEVEFSLSTRGDPVWLKAQVSESYSLIEVDWFLRNLWAQKCEEATDAQLAAARAEFLAQRNEGMQNIAQAPDFPRPRGAR